MSVPVWASDADYSPPASVGASQATKVQPSAGAIAQGLIPGAYNAAQRLNWLLNALCNLANTNETNIASNDVDIAALQALIDARSLQAAYARSVVLAETSPHIDVGVDLFQVGTSGSPSLLSVDGFDETVNITSLRAFLAATFAGSLTANGDLIANDDVALGDQSQLVISESTKDLTLKLANLRFNGGGSGQRALIHNGSGVAGDLRLESGTWTPTCVSTVGSSVDTGDFTSATGKYTRVGNIVTFSFNASVDMTGWSTPGANEMRVTLPVSTTHASVSDVNAVIALRLPGGEVSVEAVAHVGASNVNIVIDPGSATVSNGIACSGSYLVQ